MKTLKVGDKVTSFISKDQNGNTVRLADYAGKKLIVFFYPKANTSNQERGKKRIPSNRATM